MGLRTHLRHLRRLWGLPTVGDRLQSAGDRLQSALDTVPASLSRLEQNQAADLASRDEITDLLLRRLARLDDAGAGLCDDSAALKSNLGLLNERLAEHQTNQTDSQSELRSDFGLLKERLTELGSFLDQGQINQTTSVSNLESFAQQQLDIMLRLSTELDPLLRVINSKIIDHRKLTEEQADLLNWAESHVGHRAQHRLWVNDPIAVHHGPDEVTWATTNERVVEIPFAFQSLSSLSLPSRILDVGSCESLIPLQLASLGHRVTALDIRGYPFSHPRLHVVRGNVADWCGDATPYDAASLISTIEHVGLPVYGSEITDLDADIKAMGVVNSVLRPGGLVVLTTAFGRSRRTSTQRVYSADDLKRLLEGFDVRRCGIAHQTDPLTWTARWDLSFDTLKFVESGDSTVVMIEAVRPAS